MKTTIIQAFVLTALATLGVCAPAAEVVARDAPTPASPPASAKGYTGKLLDLPETPAGITFKSGTVASHPSVKARSLKPRQEVVLTLVSEYVSTFSCI